MERVVEPSVVPARLRWRLRPHCHGVAWDHCAAAVTVPESMEEYIRPIFFGSGGFSRTRSLIQESIYGAKKIWVLKPRTSEVAKLKFLGNMCARLLTPTSSSIDAIGLIVKIRSRIRFQVLQCNYFNITSLTLWVLRIKVNEGAGGQRRREEAVGVIAADSSARGLGGRRVSQRLRPLHNLKPDRRRAAAGLV